LCPPLYEPMSSRAAETPCLFLDRCEVGTAARPYADRAPRCRPRAVAESHFTPRPSQAPLPSRPRWFATGHLRTLVHSAQLEGCNVPTSLRPCSPRARVNRSANPWYGFVGIAALLHPQVGEPGAGLEVATSRALRARYRIPLAGGGEPLRRMGIPQARQRARESQLDSPVARRCGRRVAGV
jgi:hypothetical protein